MKHIGNRTLGRVGIQSLPWGIGPAVPRNYFRKVLQPNTTIPYDPSSLIGFWPQDEQSGGVSYDRSGEGNVGAYTGVTLEEPGVPGIGMTCPLFDGVNDYNNIFSAGLAADFSGVAGTMLLPVKMYSATEWTDGNWHYFIHIYDDAQNYLRIVKHTTNNQLAWYYEAGNVQEIEFKGGVVTLDWIWLGMTWDFNAGVDGEVIYYYNGAQQGLTDTGLGVFVGPPLIMIIGAFDTTPQLPHKGWIGPVTLWTEAHTPAVMAYLSTP